MTAPLSREHDDDAIGQEEDEDDPDPMPPLEDSELVLQEVLSAIEKVCPYPSVYVFVSDFSMST